MTSETTEIELPEAETLEAEEAPDGGMPEQEVPDAEGETQPRAASEEAAEDAEEEDSEEEDSEGDGESETEAPAAAEADADVSDMDASDFDNLRLVEALLFASAEPLAPAQLARFLPDDCKVEPLLADLEALYANRGVNLVKRGGRWAFRTAEDLAPRMELENKVVRKLSRVALETLAVIAYHQPVTRAEIEEIRGVALSKGTLDALLEIGWIRPKGRRKTPGRPVTWGTSDSFLDHFGLESVDALPGVEELKAAGLLDARPALTALSDRGMLPAAGEVAPEAVDEDEEDGEVAEGSEQELLEATFGENLLPHEVDLAAAGGADDETAVIEAESDEAPDEAELEMSGGVEDEQAAAEDAELEDDLPDAFDDDADDDAEEDEESGDEDGDLRHRRQRSAGRA